MRIHKSMTFTEYTRTMAQCLPSSKIWWGEVMIAFYEANIARSALTETSTFERQRSGGVLYPYQAAGVEEIIRRGGSALLADDMGIGKTIQALTVLDETRLIPALIVCRANMVDTWAREARKWCPWALVEVIRGNAEPWFESDIVIANYELFVPIDGEGARSRKKEIKAAIEAGELSKKNAAPEINGLKRARIDRPVVAWAKRVGPKTIILDEAHGIKNRDAQCTRTLLDLRLSAKSRLLLTGTPILNRPDEIGPLIEFIDEDYGPKRQLALMHVYCKFGAERTWNGKKKKKLIGLQHGDGFNDFLRGTIMIRRTTDQVLKDLPALVQSSIVIDSPSLTTMAKDEALLFDEVERLKASALEERTLGESREDLGKSIMMAAGKLAVARRTLGEAKVPLAVEFIKGLLEERPRVLVFAHHRSVIEAITKAIPNSASYYGDTPQSQREIALESFRRGTVKALVTGIQAGGTGITLAECDCVAWIELPWVPALIDQGNARARRIGCVAQSVLAYYLVVSNSIDARMAEMLVSKSVMTRQALGGGGLLR